MKNGSMLAAVYYGPMDIRVEQRPIPVVEPGQALIKVACASICGTDLRIFHGLHRHYPSGTVRIPGHEVVGEVVELAGSSNDLRPGKMVFLAPNFGCGRCRQCISGNPNLCPRFGAIGVTMDGGFAEYLQVPADAVAHGNLIPLDDGTDIRVAPLIEPLACVVRGQEAVGVGPGDVVLVLGAGPIGLLHIMLAKMRGAGKVIVSEILPERLAYAQGAGADRAVNPAVDPIKVVVDDETWGQGADVVIVAASVGELQEAALDLAAPRGRICFFGGLPSNRSSIRVDGNRVHYQELMITGTTGCSTRDCWRAAMIVSSGRLELSRLVGRRFPLSETGEAFRSAEEQRALKVFLDP